MTNQQPELSPSPMPPSAPEPRAAAGPAAGELEDLLFAPALQATPETSFYVRCDASNNPREVVDAGRLICEVGVAIAAAAEFIVFRVGRQDGVVEIQEVG